jgi:hypothetical protein
MLTHQLYLIFSYHFNISVLRMTERKHTIFKTLGRGKGDIKRRDKVKQGLTKIVPKTKKKLQRDDKMHET